MVVVSIKELMVRMCLTSSYYYIHCYLVLDLYFTSLMEQGDHHIAFLVLLLSYCTCFVVGFLLMYPAFSKK